MSAVRWPITLEEGSDFDLQIAWEDSDCAPINIASYGAKLTVRNDTEDPTSLVTASISNNRITLGTVSAVTSEFIINIPAASVDAIKHLIEDSAGYTFVIWPTAATPSVDPKRLVEGPVTYSRNY